METKVFSANSLIYRFLAYPRNILYNPPSDICELTRAVLFRALLILMATFVVGLYLSSVPYYLFTGYQCGAFDIKNVSALACTIPYFGIIPGLYIAGGLLAYITLIIILIAGLVAVIYFLMWGFGELQYQYRSYKRKQREAQEADPNYKEPVPRRNVLKEMYISHKEKTCFRVKFE